MESIKNNGILVRSSLIRPFARESTKKLIILELFSLFRNNNQIKNIKKEVERDGII